MILVRKECFLFFSALGGTQSIAQSPLGFGKMWSPKMIPELYMP